MSDTYIRVDPAEHARWAVRALDGYLHSLRHWEHDSGEWFVESLSGRNAGHPEDDGDGDPNPDRFHFVRVSVTDDGVFVACPCPAGQAHVPCHHAGVVLRALNLLPEPPPPTYICPSCGHTTSDPDHATRHRLTCLPPGWSRDAARNPLLQAGARREAATCT